MRFKFHILSILLLWAIRTTNINAEQKYKGNQVYGINLTSKEQANALLQLSKEHNLDIWSGPTLKGPTVVLVKPEQKTVVTDFMNKFKLKHKVTIPDLQKVIDEEASAMQKSGKQAMGSMTWDAFYSYDQIKSWLDEVQKQHSQIISMQIIGKTHEGRDIMLLTTTLPPKATTKPESVFIDCGFHAREWATIPICTYIIKELTQNRDKYKDKLNGRTFYIVPIVNPDGYEFSRSSDRMWRKNRVSTSTANCMGVDLNRNFPFQWGGADTNPNGCAEEHHGPSACSELECKALTAFILSHTDIRTYITIHSFGQYWLSPYSYTQLLPVNDDEVQRISKSVTDAIASVYGTRYTYGSSAIVYDYAAAGVSDDWAVSLPHVNYSYTAEVRDTGNYAFHMPTTEILPTAVETWAGIQIAVTRENYAFIETFAAKQVASVPSLPSYSLLFLLATGYLLQDHLTFYPVESLLFTNLMPRSSHHCFSTNN